MHCFLFYHCYIHYFGLLVYISGSSFFSTVLLLPNLAFTQYIEHCANSVGKLVDKGMDQKNHNRLLGSQS